jgi:IS30 family transposase
LSDARRKEAFKARKLTDDVITSVKVLIRQELNPQQVVGYLARYKCISLHHETVYELIDKDKAQEGDLYTCLRVVFKPYRKRHGSYNRRGNIKDRNSIDDCPSVVDRGNRIGDLEGDTIIGKGLGSALLTIILNLQNMRFAQKD